MCILLRRGYSSFILEIPCSLLRILYSIQYLPKATERAAVVRFCLLKCGTYLSRSPGNKGRKSAPRCEGDGEFDEAMSAESFDTFDTFASGVDAGNGDPRSPIGGGGGGTEEGSKKIEGTAGDDIEKATGSFKDGVEMLTEKRSVQSHPRSMVPAHICLHVPDSKR